MALYNVWTRQAPREIDESDAGPWKLIGQTTHDPTGAIIRAIWDRGYCSEYFIPAPTSDLVVRPIVDIAFETGGVYSYARINRTIQITEISSVVVTPIQPDLDSELG